MKYNVLRNKDYDFINENYSDLYPNIHKYPATMLPQIGVKILHELNISKGILLDPYCGSGSSFSSALECGINYMSGYDINPLAVLISKVKFTKISLNSLAKEREHLYDEIINFKYNKSFMITQPNVTNIDFWFSKEVINKLMILKYFIYKTNNKLRNFLLIPFSETVRECSYTRNNEFKLYKMEEEYISNFNPNVFKLYFEKLDKLISIYKDFYLPKLTNNINIKIKCSELKNEKKLYDVVLTSPPYGDSKTTVAYGQFSTLPNEWMGIEYARKIDNLLMGGNKSKTLFTKGIISDYINEINLSNNKRALEISSFYYDLEKSIMNVSKAVKKNGKIIYVVGNRRVKNIELPTDQFIAEKFEENGFKHLLTYKRILSNKSMPSKNSPENKKGKTLNTMLYEYIVVCEK
ncbi:hypothetical protein [Brachyspira alvinipulli]|uniref:hypothetical protein n=1 Tax=Brachyspira alvinipulli TaxID=84379 RepID=UPI0004B56225|nr:hypothetical protein [Brachyspira alvinipulli]